MKRHALRRRPAAFTLIELVISAALGSMILVSAYLCLNSAIASRKVIEPRVDVFQNARVALALLTADLRAACPLARDFQFLGLDRTLGDVDADNLDFATHNYTPRRPHEGDYCQVSYFLEKDARSGQYALWRRRNPVIALDPLAGGTREEIAGGLRGVQFEYYDGFDWHDSWGEIPGERKPQPASRDQSNRFGMPEAVRISLTFDPRGSAKPAAPAVEASPEPPLVFRTVVRLNLAASNSPRGTGDSTTPGASGGMN